MDTEARGHQAEMKWLTFKIIQVKENIQVSKNTNQSFQKSQYDSWMDQ